MRDSEEEEEEDAAPAPKAQKLKGDAIKAGAAPSKPKTAPKTSAPASKPKPKRSTRNIPAEEKNKALVPQAAEEEDDDSFVLRKLTKLLPRLLLWLQSQNPKGALGTYLLKRRTRPQCLKLLKKKTMILLC